MIPVTCILSDGFIRLPENLQTFLTKNDFRRPIPRDLSFSGSSRRSRTPLFSDFRAPDHLGGHDIWVIERADMPYHSSRSASTGLTATARRVGTQQASMATAAKKTPTPIKVSGSVGST